MSGPNAALWIALRDVRVLDDVRTEVVSAFRVLTFTPRRRTLVHGEVITELRSIDGAWTVAEMTLEATTRRSIGARGSMA